MRKRRIVPDASVMVPAFFREKLSYRGNDFDLSRRAAPVAEAILNRSVLTIAPGNLICEFVKTAHRKISEDISLAQASEQIEKFLYLLGQGVQTESTGILAGHAWRLCTECQISPPDSWYLACAILHDAELWLSSEIVQDRFVENARQVHNKVYTLTERSFT